MDRIPLSVLVWLALGFGLSSAVLSFSIDAPGPLDAGLLAVMYASGFGTPAIARDLDIMGLAAIFAVGFAASGALVLATKALGLGVAAPGGAEVAPLLHGSESGPMSANGASRAASTRSSACPSSPSPTIPPLLRSAD